MNAYEEGLEVLETLFARDLCYVRVDLKKGLFYKDGTGYKVDFDSKTAEKFPFVFDIIKID